MKRIYNAFAKTPIHLTFIALICVSVYLLNELLFINIKAIFKVAPVIRELINSLSLAVFTGYIFYVINNQLKENKDFENVSGSISNSIGKIYYDNLYVLNECYKIDNISLENNSPKIKDIHEIFKKMESSLKLPNVSFGYPEPIKYSWFQLILLNKDKVQNEVSKLMRYSHLLNSELIKILTEIEDSSFFEQVDTLKVFGKEFKQFSLLSDSYYELLLLNYRLMEYAFYNNLINESPDKMKLIKNFIKKGVH